MLWRSVISVEGLGLVLLSGAGLLMTVPSQPTDEVTVLFLPLNPVHSGLLLVAGVLAAIAARWCRGLAVFAAAQAAGFAALCCYGSADKASTVFLLDPPETFLHAALAFAGFVTLCGLTAARPRGVAQRAPGY
ncbi:hypothetical protein GCM10010470_24140 [Saccharopolyspora taberi]|uniref:DUF4383 domain-containing protein n=1 Tax=Saccharopolyspora taberi TaxID=60895 RepID=A0ABN3VBB1_9PSEU